MTFNESNTVEQMILDAVAKIGGLGQKNLREDLPPGWGNSLGENSSLPIGITCPPPKCRARPAT